MSTLYPVAPLLICLVLLTACAEDASDGAPIRPDAVDVGAPETPPDPGTRTLQRLNRAEYNNTIRDVFRVPLTPADDFPTDDRGFGFDNIGDVLSSSPLLVELYERAAHEVAEAVLWAPLSGEYTQDFEAEAGWSLVGEIFEDVGWILTLNGELNAGDVANLPESGLYRWTARAWARQAGAEAAVMTFVVDGEVLGFVDVEAAGPDFVEYEVIVELRAGRRLLSVGFANDFRDPDLGEDRDLIIDSFSIEGPLQPTPGANPARDRVMTCDPDAVGVEACAREIIAVTGRRVWRRPLEEHEVTRLLTLVQLALDEGDDFDAGIGLALEAMLVSPHFLFKVELDDDAEGASHLLSDFELATRLAYFLWSSAPDDVLLDLAEDRQLQADATLSEQVERMLADPRAEALVENFAGQWLYIRAIDEANPDVWYFPSWTEELRADMRAEAELNFRAILTGERSLMTLITGSESHVNERLATHYGIAGGSGGEAFSPVDLSGTGRVGWLAQGGLLSATSYATRTSPVRRGQWVLANLLCREPPPPPPSVEGIPEENPTGATLRERMEQHRADPVCASCHAEMDPIGFAYENFDGIGAWRDLDVGQPIDATGTLPSGEAFDGTVELADVLAEEDGFSRCIVEKTLTYAIGRGPSLSDEYYHDALAEALEAGGYLFPDLARLVVLSAPFRNRRARD